jgi:hypothetical protein
VALGHSEQRRVIGQQLETELDEQRLVVEVELRADSDELVEAPTHANDGAHWHATQEDATSVLLMPNASARVEDGVLLVELLALSWSVLHCARGAVA